MTVTLFLFILFTVISSVFCGKINRTQKAWKCLTYCLFLFVLSHTVNGQEEKTSERIIKFHSHIVIDTTGRIVVTENITVYAGGVDIRRGIIRSIPIFRKDKNGRNVKVDFNVLSVLRNENAEPYTTERAGNDKEILLGDDSYLTRGVHTYSITYESFGHIGFFDDFDEFYWNVTGNDWFFEIEDASATIELPSQTEPGDIACYTGASGSTSQNCSFKKERGMVHFYCDQHLRAKEGFTVAVSFSRDIIKRPPPPTALESFWWLYQKMIVAIILFIPLLIYYYKSWKKSGKDPVSPTIIPQFTPPNDWSPAEIRYLYKKAFDDKVFTSSIISLAVKRAITIEYNEKKYCLRKNIQHADLSDDERTVFHKFFSSVSYLNVTSKKYQVFSSAKRALERLLQDKLNIKDFFLKNIKQSVRGLLYTLLVVLCYTVMAQTGSGILLLLVLPFIAVGVIIVKQAIVIKGCTRIFLFFFGLSFTFGGIVPLTHLVHEPFSLGFFIVLTVAYIIYSYLIKAPTELGAKIDAEIKGFIMYLKTAEERRLNTLTNPEYTPELFEKMLPYAIALDVENEWGKKFDDILKQTGFQPEWYSSNTPFKAASFSRSFSTPFTSSVNSAGINPNPPRSSGGSWSSGSRGGGSSGGGGGGGGGRGR